MTNIRSYPRALDPSDPTPLYFQLKELLLNEIKEGRLGPGDRLPTEHELCAEYGISRTPTSRALSELAEEGVIVRYRQRGSFVSHSWESTGTEQPRLSLLLPEALVVPAPSEALETVAVDVTLVPPEATNSQLLRSAAEGTAPDLALIDLGQLATLVESGLLRPLDVGGEISRTLFRVLGPAVGRTVYAVPAALSLTGLWMHSSLGAPPTTWRELLEFLRTIRLSDPSVAVPLVIDGSGPAVVDALLTVLASNDGPREALRFHTETGRASFRLFHRLATEGLVVSDVAGTGVGSAPASIIKGDSVAFVGSSTDVVRLGAFRNSLIFIPFPAGPNGEPVSVVSGWGVVVTRQSRLPELAACAANAIAAQPDKSILATLGLFSADAREESGWRSRAWEAGYRVVAAHLERVLVGVLSGGMSPDTAADSSQHVLDAVTASVMP